MIDHEVVARENGVAACSCGVITSDGLIDQHVAELLKCLDDRTGETCSGAVEYRMPLSGTGSSFPRCEKHWDERLKVQEGINRRYPTHAPADFDPSYAGESWDEEDY